MISRLKNLSFFSGIAAIFAITPFQVHAYIDPGTGSMVLQLLLGGVAGAMVIGKLYWHQFLSFFRKGSASTNEAGEDNGKQQNQND